MGASGPIRDTVVAIEKDRSFCQSAAVQCRHQLNWMMGGIKPMTSNAVALMSASQRLARARAALEELRADRNRDLGGEGALADEVRRRSGVDFESALLAVLTDDARTS